MVHEYLAVYWWSQNTKLAVVVLANRMGKGFFMCTDAHEQTVPHRIFGSSYLQEAHILDLYTWKSMVYARNWEVLSSSCTLGTKLDDLGPIILSSP